MPVGNELHQGHRRRMRKRFLDEGIARFEPHEALELLLYYGIPRVDTNETAHRLINRFGSLGGALKAPYRELVRIPGMTDKAASLMKLIFRINKLYKSVGENGCPLNNPVLTEYYFKRAFEDIEKECMMLACLDNELRVVLTVTLDERFENKAPIGARRIVEAALRSGCNFIMLAHNCAEPVPHPSQDDVRVTDQLFRLLRRLNIHLADHITVGTRSAVSMLGAGFYSFK